MERGKNAERAPLRLFGKKNGVTDRLLHQKIRCEIDKHIS